MSSLLSTDLVGRLEISQTNCWTLVYVLSRLLFLLWVFICFNFLSFTLLLVLFCLFLFASLASSTKFSTKLFTPTHSTGPFENTASAQLFAQGTRGKGHIRCGPLSLLKKKVSGLHLRKLLAIYSAAFRLGSFSPLLVFFDLFCVSFFGLFRSLLAILPSS